MRYTVRSRAFINRRTIKRVSVTNLQILAYEVRTAGMHSILPGRVQERIQTTHSSVTEVDQGHIPQTRQYNITVVDLAMDKINAVIAVV